MKTAFVADKKGKLTKKPRIEVDLSALDLGSSSKMRKKPKPSKLRPEDLLPKATPKSKLKGSDLDIIEQFFSNTPGSPVGFGLGYDGLTLNAANYTPEAHNPAVKFRFGSNSYGRPIRNARGGYVEAKFDERGRLHPNGKPIVLGDRKHGGSMTLLVRRTEHAEAREKFKDDMLLEKRKSSRNKRKEELARLAHDLEIPGIIGNIEDSSETVLVGGRRG